MSKRNKKGMKQIQSITYVLVGALIAGALVLDTKSNIHLGVEFVFIMFGFILLLIGIFGLINHEVSLGNAKPLVYSKNLIVGKIANVIIIIMGLTSLTVGLFALIS